MNGSQVLGRGSVATAPAEMYKRWITELWGGRRIAEELVSPDFVGHWPTRDVHGPEALQDIVDQTRSMFRELEFVIDIDPFANGDMIAGRWIGTGATREGPVLFAGNDIMRVRDGKIVEYWSCTPGQ